MFRFYLTNTEFNPLIVSKLVNNKKNVKNFSIVMPDFGVDMEELIEDGILPDIRESKDGYLSKVSQPVLLLIRF